MGSPNKIVVLQFCIVPNGHKSRISLQQIPFKSTEWLINI
jgi:hypothetical protein